MDANFPDVLQLLSIFPEYSELQTPLGGLAHTHIPEWESFGCADMNPVIILRGREDRVVFPYLHGEF